MENLAQCPNQWDPKSRQCKVIIETPKGRRNKFKYEPEYRLFALGGLLAEGLAFPFDFGFIPSTLGEDGDPLDIMVLMDEPAHVGCLLDVRVIRVIEADQIEDGKRTTNNHLIGVEIHSYSHEDLDLSFANNRSRQKLLCRNTFIPVMEAAKLWNGDNLSYVQHLSRKRTLLAQAQMRSRVVVVAEIRRQRSLEMAGVQDDVVVEALPPDRPDESLGVWILPGTLRCCQILPYAQRLDS
jgi:hypothetical protein